MTPCVLSAVPYTCRQVADNIKKRFVWCGIAGSNSVYRVEIREDPLGSELLSTTLTLGGYALWQVDVGIWKVCLHDTWSEMKRLKKMLYLLLDLTKVKEPQDRRIEDIVQGEKG